MMIRGDSWLGVVWGFCVREWEYRPYTVWVKTRLAKSLLFLSVIEGQGQGFSSCASDCTYLILNFFNQQNY